MSVLIQTRIPRGKTKQAYPGDEAPRGVKKINVTSVQGKNHPDRLAFSPMTEIPGRFHGFYCFENFWQSGKRFKELGHVGPNGEVTDKYYKYVQKWKSYNEPHRRYPGLPRGIRPYDVCFPDVHKFRLNYTNARIEVYAPLYTSLIKSQPRLYELIDLYHAGHTLLITDVDGPRESVQPDGTYYRPIIGVTKELLKQKIMDTSAPFGHGYLVAAAIMGIDINTLKPHKEKPIPKPRSRISLNGTKITI